MYEFTAALLNRKSKIVISVEDTGIGIPKNKREAIFQEFEQGDGSVSREFAGTGLGLSISKRLVELHGGEMWVESELGKGFQITQAMNGEEAMQLLNPHPLPNERAEAKSGNPPPSGGLGGAGVFDLVLLDIMMPRISGYEVCRRIREKYLPSELPVIMVTAKNQVVDLVQGLQQGANDYLAKPFAKAEFLARIQTQLDLHRIFDVTGKFIPNEFIRSLGRERITEVHLGDQVEKEVTVLFSDIRDYTTLAETMSPEDWTGVEKMLSK